MVKTTRRLWIPLVLATACGNENDGAHGRPPTDNAPNVLEAIQADPRLSTFAELIEQATLGPRFQVGDLTIFAPTDDAFAEIPEGERVLLLGNGNRLRDVLQFHAASAILTAEAISALDAIDTLIGEELSIRSANGVVILTDTQGQDSSVIEADITASHGVIHVIDTVLLPPADPPGKLVEIATYAGLSTFVQAARDSGIDITLNGLGPLTVFAPSDAAFASLSEPLPTQTGLQANVLLNHIVARNLGLEVVREQESLLSLANAPLVVDVAGESVTVAGVAVSPTHDLPASNGVIHVVDQVIEVPSIFEHVRAHGDLRTLVSALDAASATVAAALSGPGPITLFAPTDSAFENMEPDDLGALLASPSELTRRLSYHIVAGQNLLADFRNGQVISMTSGDALTVDIGVSRVTLIDAAGNNGTIRTGNIRLRNGVVHLIGRVLNPNAEPDP